MHGTTDSSSGGALNILSIALLVLTLAGLALTFLAYQATALP